MSPLKKWRRFFNKETFDFSEGLINPYEFHSSFYVYSKLFRILDETPPKWTIITPIFVGTCGTLATILSVIAAVNSLYHKDVPLITESGTYAVIMMYKLFILLSTKTDLKYYYSLLQAMKDDFKYICIKESKYRKKFFKNHLLTFKASVLTGIFTGSIAGGMLIYANFTIVMFFITRDPNDLNSGIKPLPFPIYLFGLDTQKSPIYELLFLFCNLCIISQAYNYIFMMQTQIVWIGQVTSRADVIIWKIQDLLVDVHPATSQETDELYANIIKIRMRHIIEMHHSMLLLLEDYARVCKKFLIFEQAFAGPIVCLTAFCAAQRLDKGEVHGILILLCCSVIVLVLIPSYLCTILAEKVQSISDACWDIPFWNAGPVLRPYLILMMQRSSRPLPIQAAGFKEISLATYSSMMTNAYSCFNMLRQSNFEV